MLFCNESTSFAIFTPNSTPFTAKSSLICQAVPSFSQRKVAILTNKIISSLTSRFIGKGWIQEEDIPSFQYTLDIFIGKLLFLILLTVICSVLHCFTEAFILSLVLLTFRSRMGGWHASSRWLCQFVSIGIVILSCCLFGPILEKLPLLVLACLNLSAITTSFFITPAYPPQVHLSQEEIRGNILKKNLLLVVLLLTQIPAVIAFDYRILSYTTLGLCFCILSVVIQKIAQYKKECTVK